MTYIKNNDEQEVNVRNIVELQPDVVGDEGECCILGGTDFVSGIGNIQMAVFISFGLWNRDTEVDPPIGSTRRVLIAIVRPSVR